VGLPIPSGSHLARQHGISPSTAQRAVQLLSQWGWFELSLGHRPWSRPVRQSWASLPTEVASDSTDKAVAPQPLELEVRRLGVTVATLRTQADPRELLQVAPSGCRIVASPFLLWWGRRRCRDETRTMRGGVLRRRLPWQRGSSSRTTRAAAREARRS
jgi:hypothetical protein